MRLRRSAGAAGLVAAVLAVAGCGDARTGEVTGTVTVDGRAPPVGSSISFVPADGQSPTAGATIESGKYAAKVPVGTAKVQVRVPKFAAEKAGQAGPGPGGGDRVVGELLLVDGSGKTELTYEVKPGSQEKNWDLKSKDR
jgi:hypothetical protein